MAFTAIVSLFPAIFHFITKNEKYSKDQIKNVENPKRDREEFEDDLGRKYFKQVIAPLSREVDFYNRTGIAISDEDIPKMRLLAKKLQLKNPKLLAIVSNRISFDQKGMHFNFPPSERWQLYISYSIVVLLYSFTGYIIYKINKLPLDTISVTQIVLLAVGLILPILVIIFIFYTTRDQEAARKFRNLLEKAGLTDQDYLEINSAKLKNKSKKGKQKQAINSICQN
ncbi:hypothetical protein [Myroides injenensis]|uniref:hypothetical protein n=1 Tax=Myroides injenensis TaxID=1183151 RepID=UPI0002891C73|nr:hypothetical protein [Myroides injenensis]